MFNELQEITHALELSKATPFLAEELLYILGGTSGEDTEMCMEKESKPLAPVPHVKYKHRRHGPYDVQHSSLPLYYTPHTTVGKCTIAFAFAVPIYFCLHFDIHILL